MNERTDTELLRDYAEGRSEAAFAELVRRHVDLVHSAALRMVRDPHQAEDVTQAVFVALAKHAPQLLDRPVLSGWLHRTAQNLSANVVRAEVRRRAREQEAATMNELLAAPSEPDWERIAPLLDEALGELAEADRDALLLRYFERHSAREMAQRLGVSDEAAQKRVTRAVERLREHFAQRGITMGAGGLVAVIAANAVQAAPAGLALTISTTALAGATLATAATATTAKAIAMTTLQKTVVAATITVLAGAGIYEARQVSQLREQVASLRAEQVPLAEQFALLQREREDAARQLALLQSENADLKRDTAELPRLRGEMARLRDEMGTLRAQLADTKRADMRTKQPPLATAREYYNRAGTHYMNHDYEAQLEDLNKAIELDPDLAEAYFMRGNLYANNLPRQRGGHEQAVADYTRCLEIKPNHSSARWNRAMEYDQLRKHDEAIADWTVYIEGDTDFSNYGGSKSKAIAVAYYYRGRVYASIKRDYSKAIADYTSALQADPNIENVHLARGHCYEALGEVEKAQQDFAVEPKRN